MPNSYLRPSDIQRAPINLDISSLIGNVGHVDTAGVAAGATSLPLREPLQVALAQYARIVLFDGIATEEAQITTAAIAGVRNLTVSPLQFAHPSGTEYLTDGTIGSLADVILHASSRIENECHQSLLSQSYTDLLRVRVTAKNIRRDGGLKLNPIHYPVSAVASLQLQYDNVLTDPIVIDVTQLIINPTTYAVLLPYIQLVQAAVLYADDDYQGIAQGGAGATRGFTATIGYSAGYVFTSLPYDLREAAILFACVELGQQQNVLGAQLTQMGDRKIQLMGNSDLSGLVLFEKRALRILQSGYAKTGHVR